MAYKPLQSLFNKMYVRRGQVAMNPSPNPSPNPLSRPLSSPSPSPDLGSYPDPSPSQVAMNLIGDLQRGTMYVETAEELDQVRPGLAQSLKPRSPRPNQGQVKP